MYLAIDIGGTKTLLALFSESGRLIKRLKFPTEKSPEKFFISLEKNLKLFFKKRPRALKNVTVAIAASVNNSAVVAPATFGAPIKYGNLPWQNCDFTGNITKIIQNLLISNLVTPINPAPKSLKKSPARAQILPIYILNDADLAAYFEANSFKGTSVYLTFSTGIGGGIIKDGKLKKASGTFEPGHNLYTWQGKPTEYEDIASASAIREAYGGVLVSKIRGKAANLDIALRISTGLTSVIKQTKPDRIIIGGAVAFKFKHFKKHLIPLLAVSLNCKPSDLPEILCAKHPLESVIHGCYLYGKNQALNSNVSQASKKQTPSLNAPETSNKASNPEV